MTLPGKFRSLLATARIANVPSVVSNVWAGTALAVFTFENPDEIWLKAALLALAGVMLYLSGNFFNDWKDRDWDAVNRPERALPRGLFSSRLYLWCGLGLALAGSVLAFCVSVWSGLIALAILSSVGTYTHWHKEAAWAVMPMGLCRALLPLMGLFAVTSLDGTRLIGIDLAVVIAHAVALFLYICGLSISARGEARAAASAKPPLAGRLMLGFAGICAAAYWLAYYPQGAGIAVIPFAIWTTLALTLFRKPISAHVSALLAGIPLLDAIPLLSIAALLSVRGGGLFASEFATACILVPFISFALGRRLQRVAAAT